MMATAVASDCIRDGSVRTERWLLLQTHCRGSIHTTPTRHCHHVPMCAPTSQLASQRAHYSPHQRMPCVVSVHHARHQVWLPESDWPPCVRARALPPCAPAPCAPVPLGASGAGARHRGAAGAGVDGMGIILLRVGRADEGGRRRRRDQGHAMGARRRPHSQRTTPIGWRGRGRRKGVRAVPPPPTAAGSALSTSGSR